MITVKYWEKNLKLANIKTMNLFLKKHETGHEKTMNRFMLFTWKN
jgi:hypothetical protein